MAQAAAGRSECATIQIHSFTIYLHILLQTSAQSKTLFFLPNMRKIIHSNSILSQNAAWILTIWQNSNSVSKPQHKQVSARLGKRIHTLTRVHTCAQNQTKNIPVNRKVFTGTVCESSQVEIRHTFSPGHVTPRSVTPRLQVQDMCCPSPLPSVTPCLLDMCLEDQVWRIEGRHTSRRPGVTLPGTLLAHLVS